MNEKRLGSGGLDSIVIRYLLRCLIAIWYFLVLVIKLDASLSVKDYFYDVDSFDHIASFVGDCDRKTEGSKVNSSDWDINSKLFTKNSEILLSDEKDTLVLLLLTQYSS